MGMFAEAAREMRGFRFQGFNPQSPPYWVNKLFYGGGTSSTGVVVTPQAAMSISAVYAGCRNLGEDIGGLPLPIYRELGAGRRERDREDPAWKILNRQANPEMSSMAVREALIGHAALRGSGFAEIQRDNALRPIALWPLNPGAMQMKRAGRDIRVDGAPDGALMYDYTLPDSKRKVFSADNIFHLHGFGPDGLRGYSVVSLAREAMGLAIATEQFGSSFFGNGAQPGMILRHPKTLTDPARQNLRTTWEESHEGLNNAHRTAILEEGMDVVKIGVPPEDAQFLATREFSVIEISRWFRMPPDKLSDLSHQPLANIEQSDINYVKYSLRSWGKRNEQEAQIKLLDAEHSCEHLYDGFLQGDMVSRSAFYHELRQDTAMTGNDIRRLENLPPSDDPAADQLLIPLNMVPAEAFNELGMTLGQRAHAAFELMKAGYEATSVNDLLKLGDLAHTGFVPGTQSPDPGAANP